jgi:hypothetical protein
MLCFEALKSIASLVSRHLPHCGEVFTKPHLRTFVFVGPAGPRLSSGLKTQLPWSGSTQESWDARVQTRRFTISIPNLGPSALSLPEAHAGLAFTLCLGIEGELLAAQALQRLPHGRAHALTFADGIAHPSKQSSHRVVHGQPIKVLRLQSPFAQLSDVGAREHREAPDQCLSSRLVLRHVEAECVR